MDKYISLFGWKLDISRNTSSLSFNMLWYLIIHTLSLFSSSIWDAYIWHSFLKLLFSSKVEISLTDTALGIL
jgi:hypothetical protein